MAGMSFIPRTVFPHLDSLPRSYFLGHHRAGLSKMKSMLSSIDLVIECRDYRVPVTSRNPLFEESLAGRERVVVYTKRDLAFNGNPEDRKREDIIRQWHAPSKVLFCNHHSKRDVRKVLDFTKQFAIDYASDSLLGSRMMVVGMPNVGKSSLLNALRKEGTGKGRKVAHTGAQPGVTRKIGTSVKIVEPSRDPSSTSLSPSSSGSSSASSSAIHEGVYLLDTPGVFMPYVPDAESMLKLALCGSVKDTIIPPTTLVDYLLFHLNLISPALYADYHPPTNDVMVLLDAVARKTGRLQKGGIPDIEGAALWTIQRWRAGHLGRFLLDQVTPDALERRKHADEALGMVSMNQARKADKEARKARQRLKFAGE
ncbi:P-loop containing nucleoside triphosphate hydrolase protein [Xylona heveae TC161]|uniref:p-loop containing nucleoside triphosphate hydrolase protein n=1 Tax=Xylona heveae (strain CBS 132557 / TC161) TaxID=1328760 RepID=A0A165H590_XYLHT|nr:P-loop containing nucleoside triphosphate hydrolase protein [Xylona heveae TC161]KZF23002.1 P-loop containing nucleoside triphosphate hydrolase protein [Xylona heveae TC161]